MTGVVAVITGLCTLLTGPFRVMTCLFTVMTGQIAVMCQIFQNAKLQMQKQIWPMDQYQININIKIHHSLLCMYTVQTSPKPTYPAAQI